MSAVAAVILATAAKVGAPIVGSLLKYAIGGAGGEVAENVIKSIADRLGVEPDQLPTVSAEDLGNAIKEVEAAAPDLLPLWIKGIEGQFALLEAETKEGPWQSGWRWGWMYLLGFLWIWRIIILPVTNAVFGSQIEAIDLAIMLTLTSWFIGMYMGGHTIKELGKNVIDAVTTWKSPA